MRKYIGIMLVLILISFNFQYKTFAYETQEFAVGDIITATKSEKYNDWTKIEFPFGNYIEEIIKFKDNYYMLISSGKIENGEERVIVNILCSNNLVNWKIVYREELDRYKSYSPNHHFFSYNNTLYCRVGYNNYDSHEMIFTINIKTTDGLNWVNSNIVFPQTFDNLDGNIASNGRIVVTARWDILSRSYAQLDWIDTVTGQTGNSRVYSTNYPHPDIGYRHLTKIKYLPEKNIFVAFYNPNTRFTATSADGKNWTETIDAGSWGSNIRDVEVYENKLYAIENYSKIYHSNDGFSWVYDIDMTNSIKYLTDNNIVFRDIYKDSELLMVSVNEYWNNIANLMVKGFNSLPIVNINDTIENKKLGDNSLIRITGTAEDEDGDNITISAKINGISKSTTINGSGAWTLEWNTAEIGEGEFPGIDITADDGNGGISVATWNSTIDIKFTLQRLKNQIETYIPDKSSQQRFVIADTDNRIIDNNAANRELINEIKEILEKKGIKLYFVGGDNEATKDLAAYFE